MAENKNRRRSAREDFLEEVAFEEQFEAMTAAGETRELKRLIAGFGDAARTITDLTETVKSFLPADVPPLVRQHLELVLRQAASIADGSRTAYRDLNQISDVMAETVLADTLTLSENEKLFDKATRDALTGAYNRRYFDERFAEMVKEAHENETPLAVMFVDADHFKRVNDTYGHASGDAVLQVLARTMQINSKKADLVARYGGEEFVIVVKAGPAAALKAAERQRAAVEKREAFEVDGVTVPSLTASIGLAHLRAGDTPETLLHRADEAVYRAKNAGRNRVADTPNVRASAQKLKATAAAL